MIHVEFLRRFHEALRQQEEASRGHGDQHRGEHTAQIEAYLGTRGLNAAEAIGHQQCRQPTQQQIEQQQFEKERGPQQQGAQRPAFGKQCTPETPLGATMVSAEGACAAYYAYGRHLELANHTDKPAKVA